MQERSISIWFFVGVSLLVNGVLVLQAGIREAVNPPAQQVVLFQLHASIWWGAILAVLGLLYCLRFRPELKNQGSHAEVERRSR